MENLIDARENNLINAKERFPYKLCAIYKNKQQAQSVVNNLLMQRAGIGQSEINITHSKDLELPQMLNLLLEQKNSSQIVTGKRKHMDVINLLIGILCSFMLIVSSVFVMNSNLMPFYIALLFTGFVMAFVMAGAVSYIPPHHNMMFGRNQPAELNDFWVVIVRVKNLAQKEHVKSLLGQTKGNITILV